MKGLRLALACSMGVASLAWAGEPAKPAVLPAGKPTMPAVPEGMSPEQMKHMEHAMKNMMPGTEHAQLGQLVGEWNARTSVKMVEGQPPMVSEGTCTITSVHEGRFIHLEDSGEMMGMPFKSGKIMGFNNASKKYESVWTYTMGTSMMVLSGTSKDGGKTIDMVGKYEDSAEMGGVQTMRIAIKIESKDSFTMETTHEPSPSHPAGGSMSTVYTRKK